MAHGLELVDGKYSLAYAGETPWHGYGTKIPDDLTPEQVLEAAGLDWEVYKVPAFAEVNGSQISVGRSALVRKSDSKILDVVSDDWHHVQNAEAFEFFNDFIAEGDMKMEAAGAINDGKIVWCLAKIGEEFELFGGDRVESYLQFTNYHKYGFSTDVRFTPIRSICQNTLSLSLNTAVDRMAKISHRREFNGDSVKLMLGVAKEKLAKYKEMAAYLGEKRYTNENVVEFFQRVFPVGINSKSNKEFSRNADTAMSIVETQPGAEYAEGSWWSAVNAVSFMTDHLMGRNADTRLQSAWYGANRKLKLDAYDLAMEYASA